MSLDNFNLRSVKPVWLVFVVFCALVAGCDPSSGGGSSVEVRDFSDFSEFAFVRHPGLGFCPPFDAVLDATITVDDDGQYVANIAVLNEGVAGVDECLEAVDGEPVGDISGPDGDVVECPVRTQLPEQVLTTGQVQEVVEAFGSVQIANAPASYCAYGSGDPCVLNEFTFDLFDVTSFSCSTPRMPGAQATVIMDLLEELRNDVSP